MLCQWDSHNLKTIRYEDGNIKYTDYAYPINWGRSGPELCEWPDLDQDHHYTPKSLNYSS